MQMVSPVPSICSAVKLACRPGDASAFSLKKCFSLSGGDIPSSG
ncbi:hypothetical protein [Salmonella enterica]|nr:hypothetical protein [Salmonella enterica]